MTNCSNTYRYHAYSATVTQLQLSFQVYYTQLQYHSHTTVAQGRLQLPQPVSHAPTHILTCNNNCASFVHSAPHSLPVQS
jgi:hypothetical protein